jgi:hypothetical protein
MTSYDDIRDEIVAEIHRIAGSKTFKRKTKLRDLLPKYAAVIRESREKEFDAGLMFLTLEPADDADTQRKRRDALSESLKEYYRKEGKQSHLVLRLSDDDNKDVRLYVERRKADDRSAVPQSTGEARQSLAAVQKEIPKGTIIYEARVRKAFKNGFLSQSILLVVMIGSLIGSIVLLVFAKASGLTLTGGIYSGLAVLFLIGTIRIFNFEGTKFMFLFFNLFLKMTKQEIMIVSYSGICPVCGDAIQVKSAWRVRNRLGRIYIGKCEQNPEQHRFTFDHATRIGELIR